MFISVDLPAPFSPRSACTSPGARSKLTWSLASTPGNRLVIPRSSRSGASDIGSIVQSCSERIRRLPGAAAAGAPVGRPGPLCGDGRLLDGRRDALDLPGLEERELLRHRRPDGGGDLRAPLAVADAV